MAIARTGLMYRRLRVARNVAIIFIKRIRKVSPTSYIHPSSTVARDFEAGSFVFVGRRCTIGPGVSIGPYTMLAPEVAIVGDDHIWEDPSVPMQFAGRPPQQRTKIGADVWIGHGAIVKRGVQIADGAIIGAGSVVTHDVPPREIWAGVPARRLRDRFTDQSDRDRHSSTVDEAIVAPTFADEQRAV